MRANYIPRGPKGLNWLWRFFFGYGFWGGFITAFIMTPLLVMLLTLLWLGQISPWSGQYKAFIIGDPLLAIIAGLLAVLAQKETTHEYTLPKQYWRIWLLLGSTGSILFIISQLIGGELQNVSELIQQPNLFYHHVILFTTYISLLGGMAYIQFKRLPKDKLWIPIWALFACYLFLVALDNVHPPVQ
jgi:hypothetical protein